MSTDTIEYLTNKGHEIGQELFLSTCPLYDKEIDIDVETQQVIIGLYNSCFMTFESIVLLLSRKRAWDSLILYRSFCEGATKLIYMCSGSIDEKKENIKEYSEILPEIEYLSRYFKVKNAYDSHENKDDPSIYPFKDIIVNSLDIENLQEKYPKKLRRKILQKWSFSELVNYMEENSIQGYQHSDPMIHLFTLSSHFVHKDYTSIEIIKDRFGRSKERELSIELAHTANMISDMLHMLFIISFTISRELKKDRSKILIDIYNTHYDFFNLIKEYYKEWLNIEYGDL